MTAQPLYDVLEATGYLGDGGPAPGVSLEQDARNARRSRNFEPDAMWRGRSSLTVYFKYEPSSPSEDTVAEWRREVWNEGTAPLLWVTCPDKTDIYNGFAKPKGLGDAEAHRIRTFRQTANDLNDLNLAAGRLAMETDRFWQHPMSKAVNRRTSVDRLLLRDIARLERDLSNAGMARSDAQGLIGRSIFAQYLVDRGIVTTDFLADLAGSTLSQVLRDGAMAERLFDWLREVFNGDMFPDHSTLEETPHFRRVANFLDATDPDTGQMTLFPYQFEIIPVELISSIYEQFVRSDATAAASASQGDVHYTRLSLVSLVLDEVMNECRGTETVLDLTCGSGVFLVEALRRLVRKQAGDRPASRALIRKALYSQVFGSDKSEAALRVAAFSLYLTALELDPDPKPPDALTFKPLIGRTLFAGDIWVDSAALDEHAPVRKFDVIVGNPPWSYSGPEFQEYRRRTGVGGSRGTSLDFVHRAMDYASEGTRFGLVLGAPHFFGRNASTRRTLRQLMKALAPVTLMNFSNSSGWLFPNANMPAIVLFARQRKMAGDANVIATYQVPWTAAGDNSHTFQVGPGDLATIPLDYWVSRPDSLKAVLFGSRYDAGFLERLVKRFQPLEDVLDHFDTKLSRGLTPGKSGRKDATFLHGLPFLEAASGFAPYCVPTGLVPFRSPSATRPRTRSTYAAPLLLVKESVKAEHGGRVAAAVATTDTVFTQAFYGATFGREHCDAAWLVAGILGSSLASWFFLMTAADYGLGRNRVTLGDVNRLPVPNVDESLKSEPGRRVIELAHAGPVAEDEWHLLDEAVLDLYNLHADDRIAAQDGLTRAGWQWKKGWEQSTTAAAPEVHVSEYTSVFMSVIYRLQSARKKNRIRAEVYDLPEGEAVRVVRFVLEPGHRPPTLEMVPSSGLRELLGQIGDASNVSLADLAGPHEVQRYGYEEIVIAKPAALRHWLGVCAMRDAGRAVADSMGGWRP